MEKFYNPYHFVPVDNEINQRAEWITTEDFKAGRLGHRSHAKYHAGHGIYHGRIDCTLTTETPTFIGASRIRDGSDEAPAVVAPFELEGKPAIPATSLRGMISSVAEAASNSALRVLEDRALSFRAKMPGLSALGMIFSNTDPDGTRHFELQPLALPTLVKGNDDNYHLPDNYRKMYVDDSNTPRLKVLLRENPYYFAQNGPKQKIFIKTYTTSDPKFYLMNLKKDWVFIDKGAIASVSQIRNPRKKRGQGYDQKYCVGQRPYRDDYALIPEDQATTDQKAKLTRGIVRVLDTPPPNKRGLPKMRRHELFIPYPIDAEKWPKYPIPDDVVDTFYKLADERTDAEKGHDLPYEPYGTLRNRNKAKEDKYFRLKDGDLVYFRPDDSGESVAEIAMSAIWRCGPKFNSRLATTHDFFNGVSSELLPFNKERNAISPAEMVFGFVEEQKRNKAGEHKDSQEQATAYAGRVRFSHGTLTLELGKEQGSCYLAAVTLKILDTPKPPSPALYFTQKSGDPNYIAKDSLELIKHVPQGRKFYLHHRKEETDEIFWKTNHDEQFFQKNPGEDRQKKGRFKQKVQIEPLATQLTFGFSIDFENFSAFELGMLCYSLRPNASFRHKIGMGKPLGLGTVRVDTHCIKFTNRQKRYTETDLFKSPRYHTDQVLADLQLSADQAFSYFSDLFRKRMISIHKAGIEAIEIIGNPKNTEDAPVHYPQIGEKNGAEVKEGDCEIENYRWWVENDSRAKRRDRGVPDFLGPIDPAAKLKTLKKYKVLK